MTRSKPKNKCGKCKKLCHGKLCKQCFHKYPHLRKPKGPNKPNLTPHTPTPRYTIPKDDQKFDELTERIGRGEI